jgi:TPR repeat protein
MSGTISRLRNRIYLRQYAPQGERHMVRNAHRRLTLTLSLAVIAVALMLATSLVGAQRADKQSAPTTSSPGPVQSADEAYRRGHDLAEKKNYAEAMRWYRLAAAQGNALAQVGIGNFYSMAQGVPQDYGEALRWYRLAAAQGNSEAQDNIGFFYMSAWGVPQDYTQALNWFRKAADQGNEVAQRNIGWIYLQGLGVAQDRAEAIRWFRMAAAKGDDDAKEALQALGAK